MKRAPIGSLPHVPVDGASDSGVSAYRAASRARPRGLPGPADPGSSTPPSRRPVLDLHSYLIFLTPCSGSCVTPPPPALRCGTGSLRTSSGQRLDVDRARRSSCRGPCGSTTARLSRPGAAPATTRWRPRRLSLPTAPALPDHATRPCGANGASRTGQAGGVHVDRIDSLDVAPAPVALTSDAVLQSVLVRIHREAGRATAHR